MSYKFIFLFLLLFISTAVVHAGGKNFIDYDGDGFNDNYIDSDNNNIPDEFQSKVKELKSNSRTFTFSPLSLFSNESSQIKLTVSQKFVLLQFKARILTSCRSNFDSDFNSEVSVSTSSGGGCVGGVCF